MPIEKFNTLLPNNILKAGFDMPTELQLDTLSVIQSGANLYTLGPLGSGKSIAILMTIIKKLKRPFEDAPRAVVLVTDNEKAMEMERLFALFTKTSELRSDCIVEGRPIKQQADELYLGTDVVIATPKRFGELYYTNGVNINKLKLFILDDAHQLIKDGHGSLIKRLGDSLPKCQRLVFAQELSDKLKRATEEMMGFAQVIQVS